MQGNAVSGISADYPGHLHVSSQGLCREDWVFLDSKHNRVLD